MPRQGSFIIDEVRMLAKGLEFVPPQSAARQLAAVRAILESTSPDGIYLWAAIHAQITGFRASRSDTGDRLEVVGAPLVHDLCELALRLSAKSPELPASAHECAQLAAQWRVSVRSLQRWRGRGLCFCRVRVRPSAGEVGSTVLGVRKVDAARFAKEHSELLERASRWSRMDAAARREAVAQAQARIDGGEKRVTLVSREIARAMGRSTQTVRALLGANASKLRGKLTSRARASEAVQRRALLMSRKGVGVAQVARRMGLSKSGSDRILRKARVDALRMIRHDLLRDECEIPTTFSRPDAREVLLAPDVVQHGLERPIGRGTPFDWLRSTPTSPGSAAGACQRLMACRFLLWSSREAIERLDSSAASDAVIDAIETDLRWARALLGSLLMDAMPLLEERIRQAHGRQLSRADEGAIADALAAAAVALADQLNRADPAKLAQGRVRIDRAIALSLDKHLAAGKGVLSRNSHRIATKSTRFDALRIAFPWTASMRLLCQRVAQKHGTKSSDIQLWRDRLGMDGSAPMTMQQLAKTTAKPRWVVAARMSRVLRELS